MKAISNKEKAEDITKCLWFPQKCTEGDIQNMLYGNGRMERQATRQRKATMD